MDEKIPGAACNKSNLNCENKNSNFVRVVFHNFSGYDCHLIFEQQLTKAHALQRSVQILPTSMEKYISVQIGCLRFLDSY